MPGSLSAHYESTTRCIICDAPVKRWEYDAHIRADVAIADWADSRRAGWSPPGSRLGFDESGDGGAISALRRRRGVRE
jgi:hypothetical protein